MYGMKMKKITIMIIFSLFIILCSFIYADPAAKTEAFYSYETLSGGDAIDIVDGDDNYAITPAAQTDAYAKLGTYSLRTESTNDAIIAYSFADTSLKSITQWIYLDYDDHADLRDDLLLFGDGSTRGVFSIKVGGAIRYYDTDWRDVGKSVPFGEWFFVAITDINWGTNTYDIWLNNTLVKNNAGMQSSALQNNVIERDGVGGLVGGEYESIDEVGLYTTDLNQSDITTIWNAGAGLRYPFPAADPCTCTVDTNCELNLTNNCSIGNFDLGIGNLTLTDPGILYLVGNFTVNGYSGEAAGQTMAIAANASFSRRI